MREIRRLVRCAAGHPIETLPKLDALERKTGVDRLYDSAGGRFERLIASLHEAAGQKVVVLVDEYNKPILDALDKPDVAAANRETLRSLYGAIKDSDSHIRMPSSPA